MVRNLLTFPTKIPYKARITLLTSHFNIILEVLDNAIRPEKDIKGETEEDPMVLAPLHILTLPSFAEKLQPKSKFQPERSGKKKMQKRGNKFNKTKAFSDEARTRTSSPSSRATDDILSYVL